MTSVNTIIAALLLKINYPGFLKDSDEKLTDLRRKTNSKRGGRGGGSRKYE